MSSFFDTSALVKLYHPEIGSDRVAEIFARDRRRIRISGLGVVEMASVFATRVRSQTLDPKRAGLLYAKFMADISASDIIVEPLAERHLRAAALLIGIHGRSRRLRSLDAIQLAVGMEMATAGLADEFVVADYSLADVALREGLVVVNPVTQ